MLLYKVLSILIPLVIYSIASMLLSQSLTHSNTTSDLSRTVLHCYSFCHVKHFFGDGICPIRVSFTIENFTQGLVAMMSHLHLMTPFIVWLHFQSHSTVVNEHQLYLFVSNRTSRLGQWRIYNLKTVLLGYKLQLYHVCCREWIYVERMMLLIVHLVTCLLQMSGMFLVSGWELISSHGNLCGLSEQLPLPRVQCCKIVFMVLMVSSSCVWSVLLLLLRWR